mmetsp:Transcript_6164/g.9942  ORF Transcript_6164/g.9942 Transcript_6164/m.9942 type:complete len:126 (-) Transcript_6164:1310-1687(-)
MMLSDELPENHDDEYVAKEGDQPKKMIPKQIKFINERVLNHAKNYIEETEGPEAMEAPPADPSEQEQKKKDPAVKRKKQPPPVRPPLEMKVEQLDFSFVNDHPLWKDLRKRAADKKPPGEIFLMK